MTIVKCHRLILRISILTLLTMCLRFLSNSLLAEEETYPEPQIAFSPLSYICYQASGTINIDGRFDEASWQNAPWGEDFVDIEGPVRPLPAHQTRMKMLRDSEYLYFFAEYL